MVYMVAETPPEKAAVGYKSGGDERVSQAVNHRSGERSPDRGGTWKLPAVGIAEGLKGGPSWKNELLLECI